MRFVPLILLLSGAASSFAAAKNDGCFFGEGSLKQQVAGFEVSISPYPDKRDPESLEECRAVVRDSHKKVVFSRHDSGFAIAVAGQDVNGDGTPDLEPVS